MDDLTPRIRFLKSMDRCAKSKDYIAAFYKHFLATSDEVREKFQHTDFNHQNRMLLLSLRLAAGAVAGKPEALREIRERAETHDRHHLNIEPRLYEAWRSALIETSRQFDNQWDDEIEKAWHMILGHVIHHMIKYY